MNDERKEQTQKNMKAQVSQMLDKVDEYLENNELDKALSQCEAALRLDPTSAAAYNYLGEIHDEK